MTSWKKEKPVFSSLMVSRSRKENKSRDILIIECIDEMLYAKIFRRYLLTFSEPISQPLHVKTCNPNRYYLTAAG
jgi:hypothetical protein